MLLNHSSVQCVKQKPLVLQWSQNDTKDKTSTCYDVDGTNDQYDQYDLHSSSDNKNNFHDQNEKEESKTDSIAVANESAIRNNISVSKNNDRSYESESYGSYWSYMFGVTGSERTIV